VIRAIKDRAGSITIVESDQVLVNIEKAFARAGMTSLVQKYGIKFVNMAKGKYVMVPVAKPKILKAISLPRFCLTAFWSQSR